MLPFGNHSSSLSYPKTTRICLLPLHFCKKKNPEPHMNLHLHETRRTVLTCMPDFSRSMMWCKWATPKNSGVTNTAVNGWNVCNSNGIMHARNVNSSDSGATIWLRSHSKFWKLLSQYVGSTNNKKENNVCRLMYRISVRAPIRNQPAYNFSVPLSACDVSGPRKRIAVRTSDVKIAVCIPFVRNPIIAHIGAFVVSSSGVSK